jgi:hypothetical protein
MDSGLAGKKALVCAASKGPDAAVRKRWRAKAST